MKVISGTQFCRALRKNGWVHLRTKGSHQTWGKEGYADVTVPVHAGQDLGRGLLAARLNRSGLAEADL